MDLLAVAVGPLVLTLVVLTLFFNLLRETRANKRMRSQLDKSTEALANLTDASQNCRSAMEAEIAAHERYEGQLIERIRLLEAGRVQTAGD